MTKEDLTELTPEPDWRGSGWKHPYVIYVFLTIALFVFLIGMGRVGK